MKKVYKKYIVTPHAWVVYVVVLSVLTIFYCATYLTYGAVPGNSAEYPLGWWDWADQGLYLKSSIAFSQGNFSASEHHYFPFYSFIGSLLVFITTEHSFWLPNLLLLLGFAYFFLALVSRYIGLLASSATLLVSVIAFSPLSLQWVIPWTSTLTAFLMAAILYLLDRYLRLRMTVEWKVGTATFNSFIFGLLFGGIIATRPADFVVMIPIALVYIYYILHDLLLLTEVRRHTTLLTIVAGLAGFFFPVLVWLIFNHFTYGFFLSGPYFDRAESYGFFPSRLLDHFYSHILDSFTLYGEASQDWLSKLPIFAVSLAFLATFIIIPVPLIFRAVAVALTIQFGIYYSFSDIVPTGTFRYFNIHYFKWVMPFLLASTVLVLRYVIWKKDGKRKHGLIALALTTIIIFMAWMVHMNVRIVPVKVVEESEHSAVFEIPKEKINFLDIPGTNDNWVATYSGEGFSVMLDGKLLRQLRDYHPYPIAGGMRLLFTQPIIGSSLDLQLGSKVKITQSLNGFVQAGITEFKLGGKPYKAPYPVLLIGQLINFNARGNAEAYLGKGWSVGEKWGRWVDGTEGVIHLRLPTQLNDDLLITIKAGGFLVLSSHPETVTKVFANDCFISELRFVSDGMRDYTFPIPSSCIDETDSLSITFHNLSPISPKDVGVNSDNRALGIGVVSVVFKGGIK